MNEKINEKSATDVPFEAGSAQMVEQKFPEINSGPYQSRGYHRVDLRGKTVAQMHELYMKNWEACRAVSLPVSPVVQRNEKGEIFFPNPEQDGSKLYGGRMSHAMDDVLNPALEGASPRSSADEIFVELVTKNPGLDAIKVRAMAVATEAAKNLIELPDGGIGLVVHPDKTWEILLLDLQFAQQLPRPRLPLFRNNLISKIRTVNEEYMKGFVKTLELIRGELLEEEFSLARLRKRKRN